MQKEDVTEEVSSRGAVSLRDFSLRAFNLRAFNLRAFNLRAFNLRAFNLKDIKWGGRRGLNPRPPESQSGALPTELRPPLSITD